MDTVAKVTTMLATFTSAALISFAANAADTRSTDMEDTDQPTTDSADPENVGEAASAQCLRGYAYVPAVGACVATPYTIDRTPGAFGCENGGIMSAHGRVFCLALPHGFR
ncbi:hypothetical protein [Sorangium sp. So ce406]|uniref:hypothetical protein n=1 Tax=Sorangium sp. So ce406 TaxID=3133311 RepID=UPI003F5C4143